MSGGAKPRIERGYGDDWLLRKPGARERRWFLLHGFIRGIFWLIPFLVAALIWGYWFEVAFLDRVPAGLVVLGLIALVFWVLWGIVFPRTWVVSIGPREVMLEHGIIRLTRVYVPYDRVQQIDKTSTPIMAKLDLTELDLHSAAGGVRIYALDPADADLIAERVRLDQPVVPAITK